ncbi:hypothetical protein GCM10025772_25700 [Ferrimonas gelatinilytica]|uniref:Uncharacterized protein n=1 Tax=Ferrimonas gelatinilytica TaxID=1255257 RepID=A0ABP9SES7_9GAMM
MAAFFVPRETSDTRYSDLDDPQDREQQKGAPTGRLFLFGVASVIDAVFLLIHPNEGGAFG